MLICAGRLMQGTDQSEPGAEHQQPVLTQKATLRDVFLGSWSKALCRRVLPSLAWGKALPNKIQNRGKAAVVIQGREVQHSVEGSADCRHLPTIRRQRIIPHLMLPGWPVNMSSAPCLTGTKELANQDEAVSHNNHPTK